MSARILVVEDEEALTTLLRYNLDAEGYDVETVGTRRRCRHKIERARFPT
jgi:DNA-binding response OmpR family regulator